MPVVLDPGVLQLDGGRVLLGGDPGRLVRLRAGGGAVLAGLPQGGSLPASVRALARTLVDGGLAHPRPLPTPAPAVTVVVPVRDRTGELDTCLRALGPATDVLVVDDGSGDPSAVARTARAHGARVLHLPANVGPGAARNAGLVATTGPLVAFLDSDCRPPAGWLEALAGHFTDPSVGAVAPRVRAGAGDRTLLARYAAARGPLDLGPAESQVRPGGRVPYVPTAALLVRRAALPPGGFDAALRYGEDVDLVWRLHDAGWRVRYDPRTVVPHAEPLRWRPWLVRRQHYGTSAAPLARRHGSRLTPLVLSPWPTATVLLVLGGHPLPATAAAAVPALRMYGLLRRSGLPVRASARTAVAATGRAVLSTATGLGGAGTVTTLPLLVALLGVRRTRPAAAVALVGPPIVEWLRGRPAIDPVRWTALRLADDLAYASGVWRGCWAGRTTGPLRPRLTRPS